MNKRILVIILLLALHVGFACGQRLIFNPDLLATKDRYVENIPEQVIFYEGFENAQIPALPKDWKSFGLESVGFKTGTAGNAAGQTNENGFWNVPLHGIFAVTNDDVCNCNKSQDRLESRVFDFRNMSAVVLQFDGYQDGSAGQTVRVEIKTATSPWTNIYAVPAAISWQTRRLQIPVAFLDQGFQFRFVYDDQDNYASGFAVDNIYLFQDQTNRLSLGDFFTLDGFVEGSGQLYNSIPLNQAREASFRFGAKVVADAATRKNVRLATSIDGPVSFTDTTSSWLLSAREEKSIAFGPTQSFVPHFSGNYSLEAAIITDSVDLDITDNSYSATFSIGDSIYRRTEIPATNALGIWLQDFGDRYGSVFQIFKADTVEAIYVRIHPSTEAGARFRIKIFSYDTLTSSSYSSSPILVDADHIGKSMRIPLGVKVSKGRQLFVVEKETGAQRLVIGANSTAEPKSGNALTRKNNQAWLPFGYFPQIELVVPMADSICSGYLVAEQQDESCVGATDGFIAVDVYEANIPFSYNWSNGAGDVDSIGLLAPGNYSLFVIDALNCIYEKTYVISAADTITFQAAITEDSCALSTGEINLNISGGHMPLQILWNGTQGVEHEVNLSSGNYAIAVIDDKGCAADTVLSVPGTDPLAIAFAVTNSDCGDSTGMIAVTAFGTGPFGYQWSTGDTAEQLISCASGIYYLTLTDSLGCSTSSKTFINDQNAPVANLAGIVHNQCIDQANGSITLTVGGGFPPYSYLWSNGDTVASISNLTGGEYILTVTDTAGCRSFGAFNITNDAVPLLVDMNELGNYCAGVSNGTLEVIIKGGAAPYNLIWTTGNTTNVLTGLAPGIYGVTITDNNGCTISDSSVISTGGFFTVQIDSIFVDTSANFIDESAAFITTIGGVPPLHYLWNDSIMGQNLVNVPPGNYFLEVTDQLGCIAFIEVEIGNGPANITETENPAFKVNIYPNPIIGGFPMMVTSTEQILGAQLVDNLGRIIDYQLFNPNSHALNIDTSNLNTGIYFVRITTKNGVITERICLLR